VEAGGRYAEPTEQARVAFFDTFGIHPSDQRQVEEIYLSSTVPTTRSVDPNQITSAEFIASAYRLSVFNH
jgi:hypothetical protein